PRIIALKLRYLFQAVAHGACRLEDLFSIALGKRRLRILRGTPGSRRYHDRGHEPKCGLPKHGCYFTITAKREQGASIVAQDLDRVDPERASRWTFRCMASSCPRLLPLGSHGPADGRSSNSSVVGFRRRWMAGRLLSGSHRTRSDATDCDPM